MHPGNNRGTQRGPGTWISKHADVIYMRIYAQQHQLPPSQSRKTFSSGIYCKSISARRVASCLCSWWSSYKSVHICGSIPFYYTFMMLYRVDAPRRDQRTGSINQLSNTSTSTQSDSIPVKSDFTDPAGKYFYNQIHGTLVQTHNLITQNRRGNTYTIDFPLLLFFFFVLRGWGWGVVWPCYN